jgi:hypothetical protein
MLLLVSCLVYSSTQKMEAICSCETSGCHRTTRPRQHSSCLYLNCRPAQKMLSCTVLRCLGPLLSTLHVCALVRRRVADVTSLTPLSCLRAYEARKEPDTPVPPSPHLWQRCVLAGGSHRDTAPRTPMWDVYGPGLRCRCRYVAWRRRQYVPPKRRCLPTNPTVSESRTPLPSW